MLVFPSQVVVNVQFPKVVRTADLHVTMGTCLFDEALKVRVVVVVSVLLAACALIAFVKTQQQQQRDEKQKRGALRCLRHATKQCMDGSTHDQKYHTQLAKMTFEGKEKRSHS